MTKPKIAIGAALLVMLLVASSGLAQAGMLHRCGTLALATSPNATSILQCADRATPAEATGFEQPCFQAIGMYHSGWMDAAAHHESICLARMTRVLGSTPGDVTARAAIENALAVARRTGNGIASTRAADECATLISIARPELHVEPRPGGIRITGLVRDDETEGPFGRPGELERLGPGRRGGRSERVVAPE